MTSDGWHAWLSFISRFPKYSVRNQILIMAQKPDAAQVAGYRAWQAAGRQVRRGEKAICVLGPLTRRLTDDAGNPVLDDEGNPRLGSYGFKPMPVFDVTQTDGPDVPQSQPRESTVLQGGAPEGMWHDLARYIESHGFTVASTPDHYGLDASSASFTYIADDRRGHGQRSPTPGASRCRALGELSPSTWCYWGSQDGGIHQASP